MSNNNVERKERKPINRFYTSLKDIKGSRFREKEAGKRKGSVFEHAWTFKERFSGRGKNTEFHNFTIKTNRIILDIDVDNDDLGLNEKLEQAKEDTLKIIEYLKENHNLKTYEIWYSGKKGFHILIPFGEYFITTPYLIDGKSRAKHIVLEYANLLKELRENLGIKSLDSAIGEIKRIIQLSNVKKDENDKDRGYKICVDIENNSIDEIREASKVNKNLSKPLVELELMPPAPTGYQSNQYKTIIYPEGTNKDFLTWFEGLTQEPKPTKEAQKKTGKTGTKNNKSSSKKTVTGTAPVSANELKEDYHRVTEIIRPYHDTTHSTALLIGRLAKTAGVTDIKTFAQPFSRKKNYAGSIIDAYDSKEALDNPKAYLMKLTDNTSGEAITEEEVNEVLELIGITDTPQIANTNENELLFCEYKIGQNEGELVQIENDEYHKDGLYFKYDKKDGKGEEQHTITKYKLMGNILIRELNLTYDMLQNEDIDLFKPAVTIKYINTVINEEKTIKNKSWEEINKILYSDQLIKKNEQGMKSLLNDIYVECANKDFNGKLTVKGEKDLLRDGFFIVDDELKANNVFENIEVTPEKMKEAGEILNDIIKERGEGIPNDCRVLRYMLIAPYSFALKQLGFGDSLKNMVLWGVSNTNKTGACITGSFFYTDVNGEYAYTNTIRRVNTQPAMGTEIGLSALPMVIDESKDILNNSNNEEFLKNIVTDIIGRSVTSQSNYSENVNYPALRSVIYTQNPEPKFLDKAEFRKRHIILYYGSNMILGEDKVIAFRKQFKPKAPDSPLKQLAYIGKAFYDKIKPIIEDRDERLYDLDNLTIKLLKQIDKEYNLDFNTNFFNKVDEYMEDGNLIDTIREGLNKLFLKAVPNPKDFRTGEYTEDDFIICAKYSKINWLQYQSRNDKFLINGQLFAKAIQEITEGSYLEPKQLIKLLELDTELIRTKFKGTVKRNCFKIDIEELTLKIFNIDIWDGEHYDDEDEIETITE